MLNKILCAVQPLAIHCCLEIYIYVYILQQKTVFDNVISCLFPFREAETVVATIVPISRNSK